MEKDSGFGFLQQLHLLSPSLNLLGFPFETDHLNTSHVFQNPHYVEDSTLRTVPLLSFSGLQHYRASEPNDSQNWFNHVPRFHWAYAHTWNSTSKEKFSTGPFDFRQQQGPAVVTAPAPKRFLVFDQSGGKTTLICSSGFQPPVQFGASWVPNPYTTHNPSKEEPRDGIYPSRQIMADGSIDKNSTDVMETEMHEDTEELNALLFSDDDSDFAKDDEETSTGHSPSTMTENGFQDSVEETGEEVDSFAGPTKRRKLLDGGYDAPSNNQATGFLKINTSLALEDDAESSCGNDSKHCREELGSPSVGKRSRKDKIHKTLSILQSIIPNANGQGAIFVIDEAIHYLRSLKVKAKALGLDTL